MFINIEKQNIYRIIDRSDGFFSDHWQYSFLVHGIEFSCAGIVFSKQYLMDKFQLTEEEFLILSKKEPKPILEQEIIDNSLLHQPTRDRIISKLQDAEFDNGLITDEVIEFIQNIN